MNKEFYSIHEIMEQFELSATVLAELMEGDVVCCRSGPSAERLFPAVELEKLRLAKLLLEMEVNIPGIEIILRMRHSMFEMRRQFDDILRDLLLHLKTEFERREP